MIRFIFLMFMCIWEMSFAMQIRPVKDNTTIKVKISSEVLNRIYVVDDRINEVYGMEGTYKLQKDEEQGSIFILPEAEYKHRNLNLFIKTELGRHYALRLEPSEIDAQTIAIRSLTPNRKEASAWEISSSYEESLINFIKNMSLEVPPDGYSEIPMGSSQPERKIGILTFKLLNIYRGHRLEGQVWQVKNTGKETVQLNPEHFRDKRVKAAAFGKQVLRCNETTLLYWVKCNE